MKKPVVEFGTCKIQKMYRDVAKYWCYTSDKIHDLYFMSLLK